MDKDEIKNFLVDECEYSIDQVECMSNAELVDAWLRWEGLVGFTDEILRVVQAVYEIDLDA